MIRINQPKKRERNLEQPEGLPTSAIQKPAPCYVYFHMPQAWYWTAAINPDTDERYGWLPRPKKATGMAGVNGVRDPGYGKEVTIEHMRGMLNGVVAKGGKIIYPSDEALGPYKGYDEYYDCRDGRRWHIEPGQEAMVLPNGEILWNQNSVGDAVLKFHAHLRGSGLVYDLIPEYFARAMDAEAATLDRLTQLAGQTPGLAYRVDDQRAKIKQMNEDWTSYSASLGAAAAPVPKKRVGIRTPKKQGGGAS